MKNVMIRIIFEFILFDFIYLALSTIINDHREENVNISSDEIPLMESDQHTSIVSQSQIDHDIVEIEGLLQIFISKFDILSDLIQKNITFS